MKTSLVVFALLAASSSPGLADNRVRTEYYTGTGIFAVTGREGFESAILFKDDEKIENVAVGDSLSWQVTPNKRANVLFLKPVQSNARTNMTVVTDKRIYMFDLLPSTGKSAALYSLRFDYPQPSAPAVAAAPATPAGPPAVMNFSWESKGDKKLLPSHICDDGKAIYLDWDKDAPLPAILSLAPDGSEGPVDYTVQGNTIVVDAIFHKLVLRMGKDMATLTNMAPAVAIKRADATQLHTAER